MKESYYRATVNTPYGKFLIVVLSTEQDARADIRRAASVEFPAHIALVKVTDFCKTNSRIISRLDPIKKCVGMGNTQWGWISKERCK